jgi:flagellar basal body-associated protein FliL
MKKNNLSVDGIVLKKPSNRLGGLDDSVRKAKPKLSGEVDNNLIDQNLLNELSSQQETTLGRQEGQDLTRLDIDESLQNIESQTEADEKKLSRRQLRKLDKKLNKKAKKPHSKAFKIIRLFILLIVAAAIIAGAYMGFKLVNVSNNIFKSGTQI